MATQDDEQQPLLAASPLKSTPLPKQFFLVLFLQLAEPLTSQVIYPFAPQLIRDVGITHGDEAKVGYYVGTMQSIFFLTQAMTVLHWSRISDRIGRKPVILTGLFGLSLSMYCFGLSTTYWGLVISRSLNGALNGNIGVIKSIIADITDSTNIAHAYAWTPLAWATGVTVGPAIGGYLARPAERFPALFGNSKFLKKYPYFLPCSIPATFSLIAWLNTFLFLKESATGSHVVHIDAAQIFARLRGKKPERLDSGEGEGEMESTAKPEPTPALPLRQLVTKRVVIAASSYAFLSLVDIAFRAVLPVFLSTPIELGGLAFSPRKIGNLMMVYGILTAFTQVFFFARVNNFLGSRMTAVLGIACGIPTFAAFPLMNYVAQKQGGVTVWVILIALLQIAITIGLEFAYGGVFIYLASAAPSRSSIGATNGLSQLSVSLMRTVGPGLANSLFSLSIEKQLLGGWLVYYVLMGVTGVAVWVAMQLPKKVWVIGEDVEESS
ncbi:member of major facilitator superfamily multidrug-resistance, DHA1 sub-family [Roridomyces roridus]|uniref:Member of major facilitator superfamily multidrug-resistance, DHA1 sub-family n=1 Tax=Roridomyces roridus TaxID=1738132 RepID=A0AAD7B7C1_9AGAR|nr:member of major facilitator superfamily multidrug-resistance, DHA1 sub-family [Roridomyces roridus]